MLSRVQLFSTPCTAVRQVSLSFTISKSLFKPMPIESVMTSNHLIVCHPPLLLPSPFPASGSFSDESALCIKWPKYWSFSISPSNKYSALISFRIDWFYLLAVQGTLKSLHQLHSSKASILRHSAQLSQPHMTTGKAIAFTLQTFVSIRNLTILNFQNIILLLIEIWLVISLYFIFPSINGI